MKESSTTAEKQNRKKILVILLGGGLGILLLLIGSGWFSTPKSTAKEESAPSSQEELDAYRAALEERIALLCGSVAGVSNVRVAVSLSGGFETIYATELKNGSEVYATVGSGSNASPIVISRNPPEVTGIGVVCRGGGETAVRGELTALLSSAFRVPSNRIYISEAKK